jgi:hypothetical protein
MCKEYYSARPMAAGTSLKVDSSHMAGFLASVAGTMTVTDFEGNVLVSALPIAVGFNRIPLLFNSPAGNTVALTTAAGTLLL